MDQEKQTVKQEILVDAKNVCMEFVIPKFKYDTLKERAINYLHGKRNQYNRFRVLEDISFQIKRGESLGVIGHNGAGKSTLLKLVAGIFNPDLGTRNLCLPGTKIKLPLSSFSESLSNRFNSFSRSPGKSTSIACPVS